mmetsp:Transcript_28404/g.90425  ORF Transcript_28404/g.90425 Transcript_28404/m.90425 type:complete len:248 (+) Transcript_28404:221-964(+)
MPPAACCRTAAAPRAAPPASARAAPALLRKRPPRRALAPSALGNVPEAVCLERAESGNSSCLPCTPSGGGAADCMACGAATDASDILRRSNPRPRLTASLCSAAAPPNATETRARETCSVRTSCNGTTAPPDTASPACGVAARESASLPTSTRCAAADSESQPSPHRSAAARRRASKTSPRSSASAQRVPAAMDGSGAASPAPGPGPPLTSPLTELATAAERAVAKRFRCRSPPRRPLAASLRRQGG